jgi:hypothetical protein
MPSASSTRKSEKQKDFAMQEEVGEEKASSESKRELASFHRFQFSFLCFNASDYQPIREQFAWADGKLRMDLWLRYG